MASAASIGAPRLSQAALARTLSVSRQAVNDLVRRGVISVDRDGLIDVELARVALANRVRPSAKTAAAIAAPAPLPVAASAAHSAEADGGTQINSYHVAKTLREAAEARMAQLELAKMQGSLIQSSSAISGVTAAFRQLRDTLHPIGRKLAPTVATLTDAREIELAYQRALAEVLETFAMRVLPGLVTSLGGASAAADAEAATP